MKRHLTRGTAVLLNSALATLLMWLWVWLAWERGNGSNPSHDIIDYIAIGSLAAAAITSTCAAFFLLRTRTLAQGLKWHGLVGWSLLTLACASIADHYMPGHGTDSDFLTVSGFFLLVWSAWPITGFFLRRLLSIDTTSFQPILTSSANVPVAVTETPLPAWNTLQAEETAVLHVGRRA